MLIAPVQADQTDISSGQCAMNDATCQHHVSSYWWWEPTWEDSNSALTLHCGCLWFFMRTQPSFSRLRGDLHGWGGGTSPVTPWWVVTSDCIGWLGLHYWPLTPEVWSLQLPLTSALSGFGRALEHRNIQDLQLYHLPIHGSGISMATSLGVGWT